MSINIVLYSFIFYTLLLFIISFITSKKIGKQSFFLGDKKSPWYIVAYGMIGTSLSGVTFISVPGWVKDTQFSYMMMVLGYMCGYIFIAKVLIPVYYKLELTSIYTYLEKRLGKTAQKTGALFFILSRFIGASFRLFIVIYVLQIFVFDRWNIPFIATTAIFVFIILLYSVKGGIKTIVWTDAVQTTFMLLSLFITIYMVIKIMDVGFFEISNQVIDSYFSKIMFFDWRDSRFFIKQLLSGFFIAIAMNGIDQDMMQKNLSCRNEKEAKKNIISLGLILIIVNFIFLFLGAVLLIFVETKGLVINAASDRLFPELAIYHLGPVIAVFFIIGLISAAYSSADSAMTSLTTSVFVDFFELDKKNISEQKKKRIRYIIHSILAIGIILTISIFRSTGDQALIAKLFKTVGYTYGPLLGLFAFGLFSKKRVKEILIPFIAIGSPIICFFLEKHSSSLFFGYKFGFELMVINAILTYFGLMLISKKNNQP